MKKIIVYGAGYVGLSNGLLLARNNDVSIFDINQNIIKMLNNKEVHIDDEGCQQEIMRTNAKFISEDQNNLTGIDYAVLALPTDYNEFENSFDTKILDKVIAQIWERNKEVTMIIKSTIPIGYTDSMKNRFNIDDDKLIFSPEFLREGSSFEDASNPSRIIVSGDNKEIGNLFLSLSENNPEMLFMSSLEAESVKLFANSYLAMRVAFVNELASFASVNSLNKEKLIKGVSLDKRIGSHYFRPSLGYGGYCLPKDSKQLRQEFSGNSVPSVLFDAIVDSNEVRKKFIFDKIISSGVKAIEIDGIGHKPGVHNFRNSPKLELAIKLRGSGIEVEIVDSAFSNKNIEGFIVKEKSENKIPKISEYI